MDALQQPGKEILGHYLLRRRLSRASRVRVIDTPAKQKILRRTAAVTLAMQNAGAV
jgi:hypothetical protein